MSITDAIEEAKKYKEEDDMEMDSEEDEVEIEEKMDAETKKTAKETDMQEDVDALISGEELSEEFKEKAATIFEAAVLKRVKDEMTSLEEEYETKFAEQLEEQVDQIKEGLIEQVDGYLDYMVEQWVARNEIALENGMKSEIMEDFMGGLKSLFKEHYIDIPEEKFDLVESLEDKVQSLTDKLNEETANNVKINKTVKALQAKSIVEENSMGLTETEKEKFNDLVESLEVSDMDSFANKVKTIRECYFTQKPTKKVDTIITDKPVLEETYTPKVNVNPQMKSYLSILDSLK